MARRPWCPACDGKGVLTPAGANRVFACGCLPLVAGLPPFAEFLAALAATERTA